MTIFDTSLVKNSPSQLRAILKQVITSLVFEILRSPYFAVVPTYTIALGVYTFLTCFFGFAVSGSDKAILIGAYAFFLTVAFLAQLGSIFTSLELRSIVAQAGVNAANINADLSQYSKDPAITAKWDELQRTLHCCGGHNFLTGYNDYRYKYRSVSSEWSIC